MSRFYILLLLTILCACNDASNPESTPATEKQEAQDKNTIEYAYTTWHLVGELDQRNDDPSDLSRLSMKANLYTCDIPGKRLIEMLPLADEGVYSRILRIQIKPDSETKWKSHGPGTSWLLDGSKSVIDYSQGQQHGMQREWYPNGQIKLKRHWSYNEVLAQKDWDENGNVLNESKPAHYKWREDE